MAPSDSGTPPGPGAEGTGPFGDPRIDEFYVAASHLLESVRPWLADAMADHAAHAEGEPGDCRLCAAVDVASTNWDGLLRDVLAALSTFADSFLADLLVLAGQLLGTATGRFGDMAAQYAAATGRAAPITGDASADAGAGPGTVGPESRGAEPGPGRRTYHPIDVQLGGAAPPSRDHTAAGPAAADEEEPQ
ncbi:hypothetical protein [Tsukamurella soli]|uniref:Excreted virulence factor EspC, type VII ESX diderm n=1 Tax=Tsukamurella soli TaxID=644556 RepID=A0ABP8JC09_9ACTN